MKLTRLFLEEAFPPDEGWVYTKETHVQDIQITFILRNGQNCVLITEPSIKPYVSRAGIAEAQRLKELFCAENEDMYVQVVMAYGHLLYRPDRLPKDIVVFSVEDSHLLNQKQEPHEYAN